MTLLDRAMYVCRRYRPEHGGTIRKCADCDGAVTVHEGVYADRIRHARELGALLEIVCDACSVAYRDVDPERATIVVMPTDAEILAANTAGLS